MENGELYKQIDFANLTGIKYAKRIWSDNSQFSILNSQLISHLFNHFQHHLRRVSYGHLKMILVGFDQIAVCVV